jgi:hypothetical protein
LARRKSQRAFSVALRRAMVKQFQWQWSLPSAWENRLMFSADDSYESMTVAGKL